MTFIDVVWAMQADKTNSTLARRERWRGQGYAITIDRDRNYIVNAHSGSMGQMDKQPFTVAEVLAEDWELTDYNAVNEGQ